jgi:outer membrane biogenesis lipoprotein LolB
MLDEGGLTLEDGRGEQFHGELAEALLHARLGAPVPLEHLRYWILGAPAPGEPFRPVSLPGAAPAFSQSGWTVGIDRLEPAAGRDLPTRITVSRPDTRLKLVVTRWDVAP